MSNQPPDKKTPPAKFFHRERGEDFDIFRTDGNSSTLPGQHFPENSSNQHHDLDHQLIRPGDPLSITGTTIEALTNPLSLKQRIAQARIAQQEALIQMHAVHDAAGPLIYHYLIDAEGPTQERKITDIFAFPPTDDSSASENQEAIIEARNYQSGSGPNPESTADTSFDLLERINKIQAAQQEALNQLHTMNDLAGPSDERLFEDTSGPQQDSHFQDTRTSFVAPPQFIHEQQNIQQEKSPVATGPIISGQVLTDALVDRLEKARTAEQEALHQIKAMQDAQGPIHQQVTFALDGPLITAPNTIRQGPIQTPDMHLNQTVEINSPDKAPSTGPIISAQDHHLNVQVSKARNAQEQALGYLHAIQDADGPIDSAATLHAMGAMNTRVMSDAQGDTKGRAMSDDQGAIDPRAMQDAVGPIVPRSLFDHVLSSFSRAFFNKQEPKPIPTPTSSPELTPELKPKPPPQTVPVPIPNKVSPTVASDNELNLQRYMNSIAERIAKVKSDQLKTMNDLDILEKNTAEQIKRMEEKK